MNAQPEEFCPRCGQWVDTLSDVGWCQFCSAEESRDAHARVCIRCLTPRPASHYRPASNKGKVCKACRTAVRRRWRETHREQELETERRRYARLVAARNAPTSARPIGKIGPERANAPALVATSTREATMHHHTPSRSGANEATA